MSEALNLLSNCGLVDARINASDKDLPVIKMDKWKRDKSFFGTKKIDIPM